MDYLPSWHHVCIWQLINQDEFVYLKMQEEKVTRSHANILWDQRVTDEKTWKEYGPMPNGRGSGLRVWVVVDYKWFEVKSKNDQQDDRESRLEVMSHIKASRIETGGSGE